MTDDVKPLTLWSYDVTGSDFDCHVEYQIAEQNVANGQVKHAYPLSSATYTCRPCLHPQKRNSKTKKKGDMFVCTRAVHVLYLQHWQTFLCKDNLICLVCFR